MPSAPITPLTLTASGWNGLNKQDEYSPLDAVWGTKVINAVFSDTGALAARKGWIPVNGDAAGKPQSQIEQLFEFDPLTGNKQIISSFGNKLYTGSTALTDVTGALTPTANNWQFVNFFGRVYGLQAGHPLVKFTGTGNFVAVSASSGTTPDGNVLLSAFGRLWGTTADGQTFKSSTLLGDASWTGTGTGEFNLTNVWSGQDRITAMAAFNSFLVVFGERNIVIFADGSGSALGLDPNNATVVDTISGIGCIARDSVQLVNGDDLVFLSHSGVMSLRRVIEAKGNPLRDISANVRDYLRLQVSATNLTQVRSTFAPALGFYLLVLPGSRKCFCFDTKKILQDGTWRVTEWNGHIPRTVLTRSDGRTIYSTGVAQIYEYSGYTDYGHAYSFTYETGWLRFDPEIANRIKMLKRLGVLFEVNGTGTCTLKWAFDFQKRFKITQRPIVSAFGGAQWGLAQWGISQFGGVVGLKEVEVPATGSGQFIKVGIDFQLNGTSFSLNYLQLFAKVGRLT